MVARATDALGGVDILVNSAARPSGQAPPPRLADVTDEVFFDDVNVKVMGYLRCCREVAPQMAGRGWGRIVNIGGLGARQTGALVTSMRNVAVAALTKNLADELGPQGINVVCVHPGAVRTEATPAVMEARAAAVGGQCRRGRGRGSAPASRSGAWLAPRRWRRSWPSWRRRERRPSPVTSSPRVAASSARSTIEPCRLAAAMKLLSRCAAARSRRDLLLSDHRPWRCLVRPQPTAGRPCAHARVAEGPDREPRCGRRRPAGAGHRADLHGWTPLLHRCRSSQQPGCRHRPSTPTLRRGPPER